MNEALQFAKAKVQPVPQPLIDKSIPSDEAERILKFGYEGNPYVALGVQDVIKDQNTAQRKEFVKKEYRKLALKWHPDKNKTPGAEDVFKAIRKAYERVEDLEFNDYQEAFRFMSFADMHHTPYKGFGVWEEIINEAFQKFNGLGIGTWTLDPETKKCQFQITSAAEGRIWGDILKSLLGDVYDDRRFSLSFYFSFFSIDDSSDGFHFLIGDSEMSWPLYAEKIAAIVEHMAQFKAKVADLHSTVQRILVEDVEALKAVRSSVWAGWMKDYAWLMETQIQKNGDEYVVHYRSKNIGEKSILYRVKKDGDRVLARVESLGRNSLQDLELDITALSKTYGADVLYVWDMLGKAWALMEAKQALQARLNLLPGQSSVYVMGQNRGRGQFLYRLLVISDSAAFVQAMSSPTLPIDREKFERGIQSLVSGHPMTKSYWEEYEKYEGVWEQMIAKEWIISDGQGQYFYNVAKTKETDLELNGVDAKKIRELLNRYGVLLRTMPESDLNLFDMKESGIPSEDSSPKGATLFRTDLANLPAVIDSVDAWLKAQSAALELQRSVRDAVPLNLWLPSARIGQNIPFTGDMLLTWLATLAPYEFKIEYKGQEVTSQNYLGFFLKDFQAGDTLVLSPKQTMPNIDASFAQNLAFSA